MSPDELLAASQMLADLRDRFRGSVVHVQIFDVPDKVIDDVMRADDGYRPARVAMHDTGAGVEVTAAAAMDVVLDLFPAPRPRTPR